MTAPKAANGPPQLGEMSETTTVAQALVDSVTYDDSGHAGKGGNGGLISRETIRRADELRQVLLRRKAGGA